MSLVEAYIEVAERSLIASDGAHDNSIHEKATFMGYHAFESIGGAFCTNRGRSYPLSHKRKINMFVHESRHERYAQHIAQLAISYGSLRNAVLYPAELHGQITEPKNVISDPQSKRLVGRTKTLLARVKRALGV